jgi:hypothetical protein
MRASLMAPMPRVWASPLSTMPSFFIRSIEPWMPASVASGLSFLIISLAALLSP